MIRFKVSILFFALYSVTHACDLVCTSGKKGESLIVCDRESPSRNIIVYQEVEGKNVEWDLARDLSCSISGLVLSCTGKNRDRLVSEKVERSFWEKKKEGGFTLKTTRVLQVSIETEKTRELYERKILSSPKMQYVFDQDKKECLAKSVSW
jgi:hypothetical protein